MSAEYRIETVGREFSVIDPWDEEVGRYASAEEAKQDIDRCKKQDALYETAQHLVDISVKTLMQMHGVDRKTALYWIRSATETTE